MVNEFLCPSIISDVLFKLPLYATCFGILSRFLYYSFSLFLLERFLRNSWLERALIILGVLSERIGTLVLLLGNSRRESE